MVLEAIKTKPRRRRGSKSESRQHSQSESAAVESSSTYQPHSTLLIQLNEDAPTWYRLGNKQYAEERDATTASNPPEKGQRVSKDLVLKYRALGDAIYRREVQLFGKESNTSDDRWVESTMKKGTLKDRVAAMSVVVSTDPVHKFYVLDGLLNMAGCSDSNSSTQTNSRVAQLAAEALEDLFVNTFLPNRRKLISMEQRPLYLYESEGVKNTTKKTLSPRILLLWRFEEMVKAKYHLFLRQYVSLTLREGTELQKIPTIRLAAVLLRSIPEGESTLLPVIVNKLGDPAKKVSAGAAFELRKLLQQHTAMQVIVAREVQQLAHRPHLSSRALYNCITFLNQLKLKREETQGGADEATEPSLPASLISTYFRLFELAVQKPKKKETANEEEAGMKSRLLSALLTGVNRAHPYLPRHDSTMEQHIDALYRVVHTAPAAATTQALLLLFHLSVGAEFEQDQRQTISRKLRPEEHARRDRFYRALYSTLAQPSLLGTGKHLTMFFNLLYKAMKYDNDQTRVVAFAKRILCTTIHCSSSVVAGSLFLLNEITKHHGNLLSCFQDVLEGSDAFRVLDPTKREPRGALVLSEYVDAPEIASEENEQSIEKAITKAPLWELTLLLKHFHPSVSRFASAIGNIDYSGDPLRDFGVGPFLDKFAYRNPKSIDRVAGKFQRGESVAERKSGTGLLVESQVALPLNDPSFLSNPNVDAPDDFFHKFFLEQARRDKLKGIVRHKPKVDAVEHLEEDAFDEAEVATLDVQKFDDLEQGWETDDDEEAYVDALAQKIIEDSINENGPADLDEEDPDMEGWGDMYSDEELEDESDDESESSQKGKALTRNDTIVGDGIKDLDSEENDVDAFMDIDGADSSVSDDDELFMDEQLVLMSADLDGLDSSDDHISDSGVDGNLTLINEEKSNDGEVVEEGASLNHTVEGLATFVDADEYEAMITKSWNEKKRSRKRIDGKSDHARATSPKRRM